MEGVRVCLLPVWKENGPRQMAADEVMLQIAVEGTTAFRLYRWSEPTVSLGYFQSHHLREEELKQLPFVRRPTGGLTLVHHCEVTYALAFPAENVHQPAPFWLEEVHRAIARALAHLGVQTEQAQEDKTPLEETGLCFHHVTRGDLTIGSAKVVGSAQRRQRGALLQHGAILLASSPFATTLPGIEQLTGRRIREEDMIDSFQDEMHKFFGVGMMVAGYWGQQRREMLERAEEKYRSAAWNEKR